MWSKYWLWFDPKVFEKPHNVINTASNRMGTLQSYHPVITGGDSQGVCPWMLHPLTEAWGSQTEGGDQSVPHFIKTLQMFALFAEILQQLREWPLLHEDVLILLFRLWQNLAVILVTIHCQKVVECILFSAFIMSFCHNENATNHENCTRSKEYVSLFKGVYKISLTFKYNYHYSQCFVNI